MNRLRTTLVVVAASVGVVGAADAQQCSIDLRNPSEVKNAANAIGRAQLPVGDEAEKRKQLRTAVEQLAEKGDRTKNPLGRSMLLGQAYVTWIQQPGMSYVAKRGEVGFKSNPDGTIDLVAAADSAFDAVDAGAPGCAEQVKPYRREGWVRLINSAAAAANAKQLDSAEALAKRANSMYDKEPHAYSILASVASQRNDAPAVAEALRKAIELSGTDTANTELRRGSMFSLAVLLQRQASAAQGEEQQRLNKEAVALFQAYLKEVPNDTEAQTALSRSLAITGDTAAASSLYAKMISDPTSYTDLQLFEAGTGAANVDRRAEAVTLLEAGLKKNPYYRDALYNLAATHLALQKGDEMLPVVQRLVAVDPNNPDNWRLYGAAYQLKLKGATGTTKRAITDSVLRYVKKADEMPMRVAVNRFWFDNGTQVIGGSIENLSAKPATYALKVEFLDKAGNVVATETANVGPVPPKSSQPFTMNVAKEGIVAYRYAPLD